MCIGGGASGSEKAQAEQIAQQRAAEAAHQQRISGAVDTANSFFDGRQPYYDDVYQASYDVNMDDLVRQYEQEQIRLRQQMGRTGGIGTDYHTYLLDELGRKYNDSLAEVGRLAEQARAGFMADDEATRSNLVQMAMGGVDAGALGSMAGTRLAGNSREWLSQAGDARLGNVFEDFAKSYQGGQTLAGYRAGVADPRNADWYGTYNVGGGGTDYGGVNT